MANLNKVFLIGRLTRDPQLRYTPSGTPVADLGLAVNHNWTGQDGQKHEETAFIEVSLWARQAELAAQYLAKGRQVFIEGRLKFDSWETPEGQRRNKLSVVGQVMQFLDSRGEGGGGGGPRTSEPDSFASKGAAADVGDFGVAPPSGGGNKTEDEIPF